ncbi:hypothetical protein [Nonomuraea lactucae]|nr:hypothetical protein [Nonomuraea lactucae]
MTRRAPAANRAIRHARSVIEPSVETATGTRRTARDIALRLRAGMPAT